MSSFLTNDVVRYDATTDLFKDVFITAGSGGLTGVGDLAFGRDGNNDGVGDLYVSCKNNNSVLRYSGTTGEPIPRNYIAGVGAGGLLSLRGLPFDSTNTYLYVASTGIEVIRTKYTP